MSIDGHECERTEGRECYRESNLGLVLEGGGAKGAYQFGVLKAFRKKGIRFEAVAGTSVGALNAALWSTGRMDKGLEIWEGLSDDTIYPFRSPKWLFKSMWRLIVGVHLINAFFDRSLPSSLRSKPSPQMQYVLAALGILFFIFAAIGYYYNQSEIVGISLAVGMVCFLLPSFLEPTPSPRLQYALAAQGIFLFIIAAISYYYYQPFIIGTCLMLGMVCFSLAIPDTKRRFKIAEKALYLCAMVCLLVLVGAFVLIQIAFGLPKWTLDYTTYAAILITVSTVLVIRNISTRYLKLLVSRDNTPLRELITEILDGAKLAIPTFVTTAQVRDVHDPDDYYVVEKGLFWRSYSYCFERWHIPQYEVLNDLDTAQQVDRLLASAAIPLGIVDAVQYDGQQFVDGGTVDNCPFYPLTTKHLCKKLIVIRVNEKPDNWVDAGMRTEWSKIHRLIAVSRLPLPAEPAEVGEYY